MSQGRAYIMVTREFYEHYLPDYSQPEMQVSHSAHRCFVMAVILLYHHNLVLGFCLSYSVGSCVLERSCGSVEQLYLILVQTGLFIWFGHIFPICLHFQQTKIS